jgi:hypothetical protein
VFVPETSDNQSDAYLLTVHYDRPRFYMNLSGGYRQGGPWNGSSFNSYTKPTGGYFMSYFLTRTVELQAYGDSRITYGVATPQFIQTRYGGGINWEVHPNILLRVLGIWGTNVYGETGTGGEVIPARTDSTADYGAGFSARVYRNVVLSGRVTQSTYESVRPELDREVLRFTTSISFDGVFDR